MTTILSINELYNIKKTIDQNHTKTYNKVVELCNKKIKRIAEHNGYSTFINSSWLYGVEVVGEK